MPAVKPLTMKQIHSAVAKQEGKKHQSSIGDVREVISCLVDLAAKEPSVLETIQSAAAKRLARQKAKRKK